MFKPIKNTKVYEQVVDQIKQMIIDGTLKKGDQLPAERELAEELAVSRTSVREAIRALEVIGLVEARQGSGNFIKEHFEASLFEPISMMFILERRDLREIVEFRAGLELQAVVLSANRITDTELGHLKQTIDQFKLAEKEMVDSALDKEFHLKIADAANNLFIFRGLNVLFQLMDEVNKKNGTVIFSDQDSRERLINHHTDIYEALRNRNAEKAYQTMKDYFAFIEECYNKMPKN